jgi:hypothetical protein
MLMALKEATEKEGDKELLGTINLLIKDHQHFEDMKKHASEVLKSLPKYDEEEIQRIWREQRIERYNQLLLHCDKNKFLQGILRFVDSERDLEWDDFINTMRSVGIPAKNRKEYDIGVCYQYEGGLKFSNFFLHYLDYPDQIHIRSKHNGATKNAVIEIAKRLDGAATVFYIDKTDPTTLIAELFLGHLREEIELTCSAIFSDTSNRLISIANSDIRPDEFLPKDFG